jgi:hypothetical protein
MTKRKTLTAQVGPENARFLRTKAGKEVAARAQQRGYSPSVFKAQLTRTRKRAGFVSKPKPRDVGNGWKERTFSSEAEAQRYIKHLRKDTRVRFVAEGLPADPYEDEQDDQYAWRTILSNTRRADVPATDQPPDPRYREAPHIRTDLLTDIRVVAVRFHA